MQLKEVKYSSVLLASVVVPQQCATKITGFAMEDGMKI